MTPRAKRELEYIWNDGKTKAAGIIIILPFIILCLYHFGFFDEFNSETLENIRYLIFGSHHYGKDWNFPSGPLSIYLCLAYAPVWIVSFFFIIYLFVKFVTTVTRVIYNKATTIDQGPKEISKEELIKILANKGWK